ncbi:hypothetical protein PFMG_02419 [Plasmodium falciparum IGH-CR14]|uniref:Uncharacterized protein n=1 Tax=Plasmodium falciparum IGH-CR14 TaxID=580059 RepID=A0A0L1IA69_PLAFA|nr:hypothetical protein PFMG_02419 [Plasmodium falciparum IGH-CR14]
MPFGFFSPSRTSEGFTYDFLFDWTCVYASEKDKKKMLENKNRFDQTADQEGRVKQN